MSERYKQFLKQYGWADKPCVFLAGDCSERKYYRLGSEVTGFILLMDAPPPAEKLEDFIKIGSLLSDLGLSVPEVIAYDLDQGLALIEDFGDTSYSRSLTSRAASSEELYTLATQVLIDIHKKFDPQKPGFSFPSYSLELYLKEINLCLEWYYPSAYSIPLPSEAVEKWDSIWIRLLKPQIKVDTLVLRDFMVDNLMYLKKRDGIQRCGLLDFQDAVLASKAYDLVSLLEDARYDVPKNIQDKMINLYMDAFPGLNKEQFLESYYVLGVQRSTKILGIFTRMYKRYNKARYLAHLPRVWKWIEQDLNHPSLTELKEWFHVYMPITERKVLNAN
ncbi:MAG: aminoglycoside phosphotransferase family protein [Alphaproteobacteria bacterium]